VASLGDKGERMRSEAEVESGHDVGRRKRHGELEDALHLAIWGGDQVHGSSLARARVWATPTEGGESSGEGMPKSNLGWEMCER
jgi:hypothetical protein